MPLSGPALQRGPSGEVSAGGRSLLDAQPLNGLAGDLRYDLEFLVEVQDREPSQLGGRSGMLSAPIKTMLRRLGARTSNPYGKAPGDLDRVISDTQNIEPLLRQAADHEISTTMPLHDVVTGILRLAGEWAIGSRDTSPNISICR